MRSIFTILFCCIFISTITFAQGTLKPDWYKQEVSPITNGQSEAWGIEADASGVYWAVSTETKSGDALDILCSKFDEKGNILWDKPTIIGGAGIQHCYVIRSSDDAVYFGGRECPLWITTCDMLLVKLNKNSGSITWKKTLDQAGGYDEMDGLEIRDNQIYTGGWANTSTEVYDTDIGLWKLDTSGTTLWKNHWGISKVADHQDGHFVVDNSAIYAAGIHKGTGIANLYEGRAFLGKFSLTDGSLLDSVTFGSSGFWLNWDNAWGMTSDGEFLYITGVSTPTAGDNQLFVAKFDKNLKQLWLHYWGGSGTESARAIAVTNGKVIVGGMTNSSQFAIGGGYDMLVLEFDTVGNFLGYKTYGDTKDNEIRDLAVYNNSLYLSGTSGDNLFNGTVKNQNAFLMKTSVSDLTNSFEFHPDLSQHRFYYLKNGLFHYEAQFEGSFHLQLYDCMGRDVLRFEKNYLPQGNQTILIPTQQLAQGVYQYHIQHGGIQKVGRVLVSP
ncbi:MAG: PQQ-like beta-propeller repeat protein [Bacteroidetes bacterium]|nr:PQQ-like beta-propeller repeat protein [Bacteroidota bacterium]